MIYYRLMIVFAVLFYHCAKINPQKILDPSTGIGFFLQSDLCTSINVCPPDYFRVRELNNFIVISPPSIGVFDGNQINFITPYRTDWKKLKSKFSFQGEFVRVSDKKQESGITENDFTKPIQYYVVSFDKKQSLYNVVANRASIDAKAILAFRFLAPSVSGFVLGNQISIYVPFGTNLTSLVAEIFTTGDSVNINGIVQQTGITANDFTIPKTYTVVAADGSIQDFQVSVFLSTISSNDLKAFQIPSLSANAIIAGTNVDITVPINTVINSLTPSFSHDGLKIKVGSIDQTSGQSIQNFNNPVIYTVTAQNGSEKNYTVRITKATNFSKDITAFYLNTPSSIGIINSANSTISLTVPVNTNLKTLVPFFSITGTELNVNGTKQASGVTNINFTAPVVYSVLANDGSIKNYTVTVGF
jgi:trimeric autotransporter adhesin